MPGMFHLVASSALNTIALLHAITAWSYSVSRHFSSSLRHGII